MAATSTKRHKRKSLQHSDPGKIMDLIINLDEDECAAVQTKINQYLISECGAEQALHIVVHIERMEAFIEAIGSTILAKKFKILMSQKFMDLLKSPVEVVEYFGNFKQDFQDLVVRFLSDEGTTKERKRVVMLPVVDKPFSTIICVIAPKTQEQSVGDIIYELCQFTWPTLKKAISLEFECTLKQKCQQLLKVAKILFTQVASLDTLLQIAMQQAKSLIKAEYCSVKMVDVDRMELVEAPIHTGRGDTPQDDDAIKDRRFNMDIGITGEVIKSGTLINCRNPRDHKSFNEHIDTLPGVQCKNLLCFPIREQTGIIGVGQLYNKVGDPYFDGVDEEMALAFSIYCGVCMMHSVVYRKIQEAHIRNALAIELVMYHMKVGDAEVSKLLNCTGFHNHPHVISLHFNSRALPVRELPCYVFKMYNDLGFVNKFQLKPPKLARFILHVQKGYRDVPYHNWMHAFSVAQWSYAAMVNYKLVPYGYLNDLQALMYLTACLVHDLDHRGTTNSFHLHGQTTLAALYSSEGSVMERHHLAQAMCILNTEGCDILEPLPRREYDRAIMLLKDYILATDLANYFRNLKDYKLIADDFNKGNKVHNAALMSLLMNAADLSDQLKDWGSIKKTAAAVLTEFFKQGDVEKERGELPAVIMDRDKCFIPDLEIQFLTCTCVVLFDVLGKMIPKVAPCHKILENHIERWDLCKPIFAEVPITAGLSVLLSPDLDNLIELQIEERARLAAEAARAAALAAEEEEEDQ